jgi:hypothetical protein
MLELFDIGESRLRALFDGQPLDESDEETIAKLLFRFPRMGIENIHRWRRPLDWQQLVDDPDSHRAEVFEFSGVVKKIERKPLIEELSSLFEFSSYWLLTVEAPGLPDEVLVCTRSIPKAWLKQAAHLGGSGEPGSPGQEPSDSAAQAAADVRFGARFQGFFLKIAQREPRRQLVFAAPRAQWQPLRPDPELGVTPSRFLLGQLGMDVSRLEDLPEQNGRRPNSQDREAFYQMLWAADQLPAERLEQARRPPADLEPLLVRPETLHGELMTVKARAVRVTLIRVEDPDIKDRFGISQYYQIDLAIPLGKRTFQLKTDSGASPEYNNSFPGTVCVLELPREMRDVAERMAAGKSPSELYDKQLVAEAFFFKTWGYRSQFLREEDAQALQPAPMFMAARLRLQPVPGIGNSRLALIVSVVFLLALAATATALWRSARGDQQFVEDLQDRNRPAKSLNDMNLPVQDEPDFSHLPK